MTTTFLLSINAALIALNGFLAAGQLDDALDGVWRAVIAVGIGVLLAGIGPFLPKVSETFRRTMGLQRRG